MNVYPTCTYINPRSGAIFIILGKTTQENVQQHVKIGPA